MLNGAIIGLGNIAVRGHVPAFKSADVGGTLHIAAVLDVVAQNKSKAHELLPGAKFYTDVDAFLANETPDFVDICTPPHTHGEYVRACAGRGIHIICEKPLAESSESASRIVRAVGDSGVVFVPCHQYKYSPLWKTVHDMIAAGTLGTITLAQFNVYRMFADTGTAAWNPRWRTSKATSGGGILVDTGAHYFYLAQYFFGVPKTISAILRTLKHADYGVEDTAVVTLEYPATLMQINLTWAASHRANNVYIAGTEGSLSYDGAKLLHTGAGGTKEIPMPDVSDKNQYVAWYAALFMEFAGRIERNDRSTGPLDEAMTVMKMLEMSYRSSERNEMITLA